MYSLMVARWYYYLLLGIITPVSQADQHRRNYSACYLKKKLNRKDF